MILLDQRSDAVFAEYVAEGFSAVATVRSEVLQVTGVAPGGLRIILRDVFRKVVE